MMTDDKSDGSDEHRFGKIDEISDTEWLKLMNKKIDVNMTDTNGRNPLFVAGFKGYIKMVKLLIETGIDVDIIDLYGKTALEAAQDGLKNATSENRRKNINAICNLLRNQMKPPKEGPDTSDAWTKQQRFEANGGENNNDETPNGNMTNGTGQVPGKENQKRRSVTNTEIIWTSTLIFIGK
eukprot:267476_1